MLFHCDGFPLSIPPAPFALLTSSPTAVPLPLPFRIARSGISPILLSSNNLIRNHLIPLVVSFDATNIARRVTAAWRFAITTSTGTLLLTTCREGGSDDEWRGVAIARLDLDNRIIVHNKNTRKFKATALTKSRAMSFGSFGSSVFSAHTLLVGALGGTFDGGGWAMVTMCGWYWPRQQSKRLTFFRY